MAWTDTLNEFGLTGTPPAAQSTPLQVATTYAPGTFPGNNLSGQLVNQLSVGNAADPNSSVYITNQGIFAGNSVFEQAPFSVDIHGNLVALSGTFSLNIVGGSITIGTNPDTFNVDREGNMWIGASTFAAAPFSVKNDGSEVIIGDPTGQHIEFGKLFGITEGMYIFDTSGSVAGAIYGSTGNGIVIQDANAAGANEFLAFDGTGKLSYLGGYNGTDISSQLGNVTLSIGAGTPTNIVTVLSSGVEVTGDLTMTTGSVKAGLYQDTGSGVLTVAASSSGEIILGTGVIESVLVTGENITLGAGLTTFQSDQHFFQGFSTPNTTVTIEGDFGVTGTKGFDMVHPTKPEMRLKYIAVESPEVLVVCRGNGTVVYPQHFIDVSEPGSDQVIVDKDTGNWIATAIRKGYSNFEPEYTKS